MKNARFYDAGNNKQGLGLDRVVSTNSKEAIFMRHLGNDSEVVRRVADMNEWCRSVETRGILAA
jgi:hypothetical protein